MPIKKIKITDLVQDDRNLNRGNARGKELIETSVGRFGAGRSVLIDKNNRIIAGNKTQEAAIAKGIKDVIVVETDGAQLVAVKRNDVDLDSKDGREMALADNATVKADLEWDTEELSAVAEDFGIDVEAWDVDLDGMTEDTTEAEEDDFDEEQDEVKTVAKRGDIFVLGNHRLMCGDSTKAEDVARLMQGEKADLWLTDPPYNVDYSAAKNRTNIVAGHDSNRKSIENDTMSDAEFQSFLDNVCKAADSVMRVGCSFYIWHSHTIASKIEAALAKSGLQAKQQLIWNKNSIVLGWLDYKQKHEPCFYGYKGSVNDHYFIKTFNRPTVIEDGEEIDIDKMKKDEMKKLLHEIFDNPIPSTVINEKRPTKAKDHPTMKPVRLFGYQMANSSRPGDIILDTFGGSGTTIIAAQQLDRRARLMELDPHYCDVIIARWEKLTGQQARKIEQ